MANTLLSTEQVRYLQRQAGLLPDPLAAPPEAPFAEPQPVAPATQVAPVDPLAQPAPVAPVAPAVAPAQPAATVPPVGPWGNASATLQKFFADNKVQSPEQFKSFSFAKRMDLLDRYTASDEFKANVVAAGGEDKTDLVLAKAELRKRYMGKEKAPETVGLRTMLDPLVALPRGAVSFAKNLADVAGAGNYVANQLEAATKWLGTKMSPGALELGKQRDEELASATTQVQKAAIMVKYAAMSPVTSTSEAVGNVAGLVGTAALAVPLGAPAVTATAVGLGVASGAGAVKGQIYDTIKNAPIEQLKSDPYFITLISSGEMDEKQAREILAQARQSYAGAPTEIGFGAVVAAIASRLGATGEATKLITRQMQVQAARGRLSTGGTKSVVGAGLVETGTELGETGLTRVASNYAAAKEGAAIPITNNLGEDLGGAVVGAFGVGAGVRTVSRNRDRAFVQREEARVTTEQAAIKKQQDVLNAKAAAAEQAQAAAAAVDPIYAQIPEGTRGPMEKRLNDTLAQVTNVLSTETDPYAPQGEGIVQKLQMARDDLNRQISAVNTVYGGEGDNATRIKETSRYSKAISSINSALDAVQNATGKAVDSMPNQRNGLPVAVEVAAKRYDEGRTQRAAQEWLRDTLDPARFEAISAKIQAMPGEQQTVAWVNEASSALINNPDNLESKQATLVELAALRAQLDEAAPGLGDRIADMHPMEIRLNAQDWLTAEYGPESVNLLASEINELPVELRTSAWVQELNDAVKAKDTTDPTVVREVFNKFEYTGPSKRSVPNLANFASQREIPNLANFASQRAVPNLANFASQRPIPNLANFASQRPIPNLANEENKPPLVTLGDYVESEPLSPITQQVLEESGLDVPADLAELVARAQATMASVYTAEDYADFVDMISEFPDEMQAGEWVYAASEAAKGNKNTRMFTDSDLPDPPNAKEAMTRYKAVVDAISNAIGMDVRKIPQIKILTDAGARALGRLRGSRGMWLGKMDPVTGTIYINSWNTAPQHAYGVLLHEVAHKRLHFEFDVQELASLYDQVQQWATAPEGSVERAVYARAAEALSNYEPGERQSEWLPMVVGYAQMETNRASTVGQAPPSPVVQTWLEQVKDMFRRALAAIGIGRAPVQTDPTKAPESPLTVNDLLTIADGLLKAEVENRGTPPEVLASLRALNENPDVMYALKMERAGDKPPAKAPVTYAEAVDMQDKTRATASRANDGTWTVNIDGVVNTAPDFNGLMDLFSDAGLRYVYRAKNMSADVAGLAKEMDLDPQSTNTIQSALAAGIPGKLVGQFMSIKRALEFKYLSRLEGLDRIDALRGVKRGDANSLVDRTQLDRAKIDAELAKPGFGADSLADSLLDAEKVLKKAGLTTELAGAYWYAVNAKDRYNYLKNKGPFYDSNGKVKTVFTGLQFEGSPDDDGSRTLASAAVQNNLPALERFGEYMRASEQRVSEAEFRSGVIDKLTFNDRKDRKFQYAPFRTYNPEKSLASMEAATGRTSQADNPYIIHQATLAARMSRAMANETRVELADAVSKNLTPSMANIIKPVGELQLDRNAVTDDVPAEWVPVRREEDVVTYYKDGKAYGLKIVDPNLRKTMKHTDIGNTLAAINGLRNFYQGTLTRWNPAFLFKAAGWDMITAYSNAQGAFGNQNINNKDAGRFARAVITNAIAAMKPAVSRGVTQKSDDAFMQLFVTSGGELDFSSRYADTKSALASLNTSGSNKILLGPKNALQGGLKRVEGVLQSVEQAVRAGGFRAYLEYVHGGPFASNEAIHQWAKENPGVVRQAAIGSKRLVTNFEQTGDANLLRSWLLFFNPAMQGAFSMVPSIMGSAHGRKTALTLGLLAALSAAAVEEEEDDDGRDKIIKRKGYGDRLFFGDAAVDVPPEMRPFVAAGYAAVGVMKGQLDSDEAVGLVTTKMVDALSPFRVTHEGPASLDIGNRFMYNIAGPVQVLAPLVTGKDFFGRAIESNAGLQKGAEDTRPKFTKGRSSDSSLGYDIAKWAYGASDGAVNTSPYMVDAVIKNVGGGWANLALGVDKEQEKGASLTDALAKKLGASYAVEHNKYDVRSNYEVEYNKINAKLYAANMAEVEPAEGRDILAAKGEAIAFNREEIESVTVGGKKLSELRTELREARVARDYDLIAVLNAQIDVGMSAQNQLMGQALMKLRALK